MYLLTNSLPKYIDSGSIYLYNNYLNSNYKKIAVIVTLALTFLTLSYIVIRHLYPRKVKNVANNHQLSQITTKNLKNIQNEEEQQTSQKTKDISNQPKELEKTKDISDQPKELEKTKDTNNQPNIVKTGYRKTFDEVFTGKYSIDELPFYKDLIHPDNPDVLLDKMASPVMHGQYGHSINNFISIYGEFIAIVVNNLKNGEKKVITLYSRPHLPNEWKQVEMQANQPVFFNDSGIFTNENGELLKSQTQNFESFKKLFIEGKSEDVYGNTWSIEGFK